MALNYQLIGRRIHMYRKRSNISQMVLAEMIGKSPSFVSCLEKGSKSTSLETLIAIANSLHVTADELLVDHLSESNRPHLNEYNALWEGCTEYEKRILITNIYSLKKILQEHRSYMPMTQD